MGNAVVYAMGGIFLVFLIVMTYVTYRKDQPANEGVVSFDHNREQKLWQGTARLVVTDKGKQYEDLDVVIYDDGIFIGYVSQAYPFFYIEASAISRQIAKQGKIMLYLTGDSTSLRSLEFSIGESNTSLVLKKITFIQKRAKKQQSMG